MRHKALTWLYVNSHKVLAWLNLIWVLLLVFVTTDITVDIESMSFWSEFVYRLLILLGVGIVIEGTVSIVYDKKQVKRNAIEKEYYINECKGYLESLNDKLQLYKESGKNDYDYMKDCVDTFDDLIKFETDLCVIEKIYFRLYKLLDCNIVTDVYNNTRSNMKDGEKMKKIKGKKLKVIQKTALVDSGVPEEDVDLYLYQKDITEQEDGSKNLNSNVNKTTYWQFINRETGEIKLVESTR